VSKWQQGNMGMEFMYLFIQDVENINTRYLYAFPIWLRDADTIMGPIENFHQEHPISSITGAGEGAWATASLEEKTQEKPH
jgi:hypothetical protein